MTTPGPSDAFAPRALFPVPVWVRELVDAASHNERLLTVYAALKQNDADGVVRSNQGGWHSGDQIHRQTDMAALTRAIGGTAARCADAIGFDFSESELFIRDMWFNENGPGDGNRAHTHPGAFLSGVYYVAAQTGAGSIEFYDPVAARVACTFPKRQGTADDPVRPRVAYRPRPGLLILFPGWLMHAVEPNRSSAPRLSLSFNIHYRKKTAPSGT